MKTQYIRNFVSVFPVHGYSIDNCPVCDYGSDEKESIDILAGEESYVDFCENDARVTECPCCSSMLYYLPSNHQVVSISYDMHYIRNKEHSHMVFRTNDAVFCKASKGGRALEELNNPVNGK